MGNIPRNILQHLNRIQLPLLLCLYHFSKSPLSYHFDYSIILPYHLVFVED